jgi:glucokinase
MTVKAGAVDAFGRIAARVSFPTNAHRPQAELTADIAASAREAADKAGARWSDVSSVGVGMPGTVDDAAGLVRFCCNLGWRNVSLGGDLARLLNKPVRLANDADAAALGEHRFGAGKKYASSILFTLGTGVGAGIILDGKIFSGFRGAGAELGHTVIMTGGRECACGRRGCFEAYASVSALIRQTAEAMRRCSGSLMHELATPDTADGKTAFAAAERGDGAARGVIERYIGYLSEGIANAVNAFRPEAVIIGGGVSLQGGALLNPLRTECVRRIYGGTEHAPLDFLTAALGNDAGIIGAACI